MIYLSLGSNLHSNYGDRFNTLIKAIEFLKEHEIELIKKSHFYETLSFPNKKDPKFINLVLSVKTKHTLPKLMSKILIIEKDLGRIRKYKNDPRTCDIDIIDFNGEINELNNNEIKIKVPHEKLHLRNFVLFPLQEISPNWKHPQTGEIIYNLISKLSEDDKKSILKIKNN